MLANNVMHTGAWPIMMRRSGNGRSEYTYQNCHEYAFCTEHDGTYTCECLSGMKGDGFECEDILECSNDPEGAHDCHADATCTEEVGYFTCACKTGYYGDGNSCRDIDECSETADTLTEFLDTSGMPNIMHNCDTFNGICTNHVPADDGVPYACSCKLGSDDVNGDGTSCPDIDECAADELNNCRAFTDCNNENLSFGCTCIDGGFTGPAVVGDSVECADINECEGENVCDVDFGVCSNNDGSYSCSCPSGFEDTNGDGTSCRDLDECLGEGDGHGICGDGTVCENSPGSFDCVCMPGYHNAAATNDGTIVCPDIDECESGTDDCGADADCTNTDGGFECSCSDGFEGDGYACTDLDECAGEGAGNDCDGAPRGSCTNTHGGYTCACNAGYEDVDETADTGTSCQLIYDCNVDNGGCSHLCYIPTGCECPGTCWTIGDDLMTCEPSVDAVTLNCSANMMEIEIDSCLFDNEHYSINFRFVVTCIHFLEIFLAIKYWK